MAWPRHWSLATSKRTLLAFAMFASGHIQLQADTCPNLDLPSTNPPVIFDQACQRPEAISNESPVVPWTHKSYCVEATGREEQDEGDDVLREAREVDENDPSVFRYCVYTDASFGKYGLSVIVNPGIVEAVVENVAVVSRSGFPHNYTVQQLVPRYDSFPAVAIVEMPDKGGKGMVATRSIRRYETFLVDFAAISLDAHLRSALSRAALRQVLDRAAGQLNSSTRTVLPLSRGGYMERDGVVDDVIRANAFGNHRSSWKQSSLFPEISRINHDCQPNSFLRMAHHGLTAGVAAFRDIEPGEEITLSYISPGLARSERHKRLQEWNFRCQCRLCSASEEAVQMSDALRSRLQSLSAKVASAMPKWDMDGAVTAANEALALLEACGKDGHGEEDCVALEASHAYFFHGVLGRLAAVRGDDGTAARHARIASKFRVNLAYLEPRNSTADFEELMVGF